jgi:hypothetical protein
MKRVGEYTSKQMRRCLTSKEMRAKGMHPSAKGARNSGLYQRHMEQMQIWPSPKEGLSVGCWSLQGL